MTWTKRQNEIIDTALKLTADGGIQNLTVKKLSEAIGISEPALYRHFRSKSEIIKAMITRFDTSVPIPTTVAGGLNAIKYFIRQRMDQVCNTPELARVLFAEEMFMDDPEFQKLMFQMIHRHKAKLEKHFKLGREQGEIRSDIPLDILFRLVFGPVRLLVKQWGLTGGAFDLRQQGEELITALEKILLPVPADKNHHPQTKERQK